MKKINLYAIAALACSVIAACSSHNADQLPNGFVYLKDVDPSIKQDMRYTGDNNLVGHPLAGYKHHGSCILTQQTAEALKQAQTELKQSNLSLMVYDCYRPQSAIDELITWTHDNHMKMKKRFYPNIDKSSPYFQHFIVNAKLPNEGSALDVTIVPIPMPHPETYIPDEVLENCTDPYLRRFQDGSIDMGTGYDCFDPLSNVNSTAVDTVAYYNRHLLRAVMEKNGFVGDDTQWWFFSLKKQAFTNKTFNFPVN